MIPQRIPNPRSELVDLERVCSMARTWGLRPLLMDRLIKGAASLPFEVLIFSGARSRDQQDELEAQGRPTAPFDDSTHADRDRQGCPRRATGADVWPASEAVRLDRAAQAALGAAMVSAGLRWGGGSPVDPTTGIPSDTWHFDLGARTS